VVEGVQAIVSLIESLTEANGSDDLSIQALGITTILNALPMELEYLKADLESTSLSVMTIVTRISTEMASIRNSVPFRGTSDSDNLGQAHSATKDQSSKIVDAKCKHCGEAGHYSAKWSNCAMHDPKFELPNRKRPRTGNSRVGANVTENKTDLRNLIPTFSSNLNELDEYQSERSAFAVEKISAPMNSRHSKGQSNNVNLTLTKDTYAASPSELMVVDSGASPSYFNNKDILTNITYSSAREKAS
jgi:hypothetical protein